METTKYALEWDGQGQKQYELGVSKGVLYKYDGTAQKWIGVAWNGLTSVSESPDGAEENELWADNIKYGGIRSAEKFSGSIEAYTYPDEFEGCDGLARPTGTVGLTIGQQKREKFCLCYRTEIGNDQDPEAGYRLHLVYNAACSPSEKSYSTVNDSPEAGTFSFEISTVPVAIPGYKNTAILTIDSTKIDSTHMAALEALLYGGDSTEATLPSPETVLTTLGLTYSEQTGQWSS